MKYSNEVEKLFSYGYTNLSETWPSYTEEISLKEEHADELIDLVRNSNLSHANSGFTIRDFAPRHAWRALGQLKVADAAKPLLNALIIKKNVEALDYRYELPKVLLLIGSTVIPELDAFLKNEKIEWSFKVIVFQGMVEFAVQESKHREVVFKISNDLFLKNESNHIFISRILNALFILNPIDSEIIKEIIDKNNYDPGTINEDALLKFIKNSGMYD